MIMLWRAWGHPSVLLLLQGSSALNLKEDSGDVREAKRRLTGTMLVGVGFRPYQACLPDLVASQSDTES